MKAFCEGNLNRGNVNTIEKYILILRPLIIRLILLDMNFCNTLQLCCEERMMESQYTVLYSIKQKVSKFGVPVAGRARIDRDWWLVASFG